ncbi:SH3-domain-containing protein [Cylindrobasidium torrendii FP15055 ss-10]|uniref:SH3-domain-containing protein n=1 Tax=Cylindrobasidium torrendii FP15055 ss-10 TaxID=1314674 RepID=A0A0D7AZR8_9AGAR|nr:SH3-domain-containing protein [Cylindrobasidium torrendii FP15055 ss-10]
MVFTNFSHQEKDAFFSLLDEYFQSRPELAAKLSGKGSVSTADVGNAVSRAASAFGSLNTPTPPPPARRSPTQPPPDRTPAGLVSAKVFGTVDTTNKMSMLTSSLRKKTSGNPINSTPPPPPAFQSAKNTFAPPPKRTLSAEPPSPAPRTPQRQLTPEPPQGEWAEALYDYNSGEDGDLAVKAGQQVWVTEKSSPEWWTGTLDGRSGLFPASYVKLL